jgi:FkbM family methyltransferase
MIASAKKILYKSLSQNAYLKTLHRSFFLLFDLGMLKKKQSFKYHYMVRNLIREDDTIVDIGANLGYFSRNFARLAPKGKLIAIEPVPPFFAILTWALRKYPHVTLLNYALGTENGSVTMVLPETNGMIRTGLPHIASEEEKKQHKTVEVPLAKGSELLAGLDKLNYIKCDIEGFETIVFPEIREVLTRHQPLIQIEIGPENEAEMLAFFRELGFEQFGIRDFRIVRENGSQQEPGDFLFVHRDKADAFITDMKAKNLLG